MDDETLTFASLMCSRLCHDLLSPVGAFGNGLELLADEHDAEMRDRCTSLLESSATTAINKLKYFRLTFGSSGGYGDTLAQADIVDAISGLVPETRKVTINWLVSTHEVDKRAARVMLSLAMVVVDALVRGGSIDIAMEARGPMQEIVLRGSGPRVVIDQDTADYFAAADAVPSSRTISVALARRIAQASGGDVMLSRPADGEIVVGALLGTASKR